MVGRCNATYCYQFGTTPFQLSQAEHVLIDDVNIVEINSNHFHVGSTRSLGVRCGIAVLTLLQLCEAPTSVLSELPCFFVQLPVLQIHFGCPLGL